MIGAVVLGLALATAPVSDADRKRAFELADEAETRRGSGDLGGARAALAEAYQLDPNPYFLFGRGRLAAEAGDCDEAVTLMRDFLEKYPDADGTEAARNEIDKCGGTVEQPQADPEPEPAPQPIVAPRDVPPPPPTDEPEPWYRDKVGNALLGVGAGTLALGAGLYTGAHVVHGRAPDAATTDAFRRSTRRARGLEISGVTLMAVGGSLVVGAIIRYATRDRARRSDTALTFRF